MVSMARSSLSVILVLAAVVCCCQAAYPYIPTVYPLFKQCDSRWGQNLMGGNNTDYDTICIQGCAMSSLSMALHGRGYTLSAGPFPSVPINPASLNAWLQNNDGYTCIDGNCNNLVLDAPDGIAPGDIRFIAEDEKPGVDEMQAWVDFQNPLVIAHVRENSHFVLVVGYDLEQPNTFYVNDPYYNNTSYMYDEMSDLLTYLIRMDRN
mmetsp:Transcript_8250/g.34651  ORF Transcript_8250/g.34651 Transcript_8250/m.34651 type:complete len:207 (+) Transcript_8250:24-644(+)